MSDKVPIGGEPGCPVVLGESLADIPPPVVGAGVVVQVHVGFEHHLEAQRVGLADHVGQIGVGRSTREGAGDSSGGDVSW